MYPFMGQECTLQTTNRVEVLVLLCREVWVFLSRHGDGGLFWFSIENPQKLLHSWNEIHKSLNFCMSAYRSFRERSPSLIFILENEGIRSEVLNEACSFQSWWGR